MTKQQLIRKLNEINTADDPEINYSKLYKLVWDFMDRSNCHLLEDIFDNYVNEDHAASLVEQNIHDFETIWYLMRDIEEMSGMYYMDGWCLRNINTDDIVDIIDEIFERLEKVPDTEDEDDNNA
ncbi:MAG: hypothetical protein IJF84_00405 [Thermoguttaceae bacterium]|nr:hypothetical protein [Thermoguttaceae bacterium]